MFELIEPEVIIKVAVIGIGGCGCNTIDSIYPAIESSSVTLFTMNTDKVVLEHGASHEKLLMGSTLTQGFGAGADPEIGKKAAEESMSDITNMLEPFDIIICATGLGGGTGTGASPVIAEIINKELDKPCIFIATSPFESEGPLRNKIAMEGLESLKSKANAVINLPNDKLIKVLGEDIGLFDAFRHSNQILQSLIRSLLDMLSNHGLINVDLKDFANVMNNQGDAILGVGKADTEDELTNAVNTAINNPLVEAVDLTNSSGAIIQISCSQEISIGSYNKVISQVREKLPATALVICGVSMIENLSTPFEILVIATGINQCQSFNVNVEQTYETDEHEEDKQNDKIHPDDLFSIPAYLRQRKDD
ncbi:cell division protein FtsZ [Pseudoalteromonas piratica]|uniref:Cell division protein FtsZ n=1 Tax=Pseudoalteromonas piratica TaxID=1348114 RepID=A0A0A7EKW9_9GAMM|nr:cell division protein FtsZ [Pseudoalteromonas piratica]AIY66711.1 cell division protein FtsZ [Pseudoalteromonas piratica]